LARFQCASTFGTLSVRIDAQPKICFGGTMIKSEIIQRISVKNPHLRQHDVEKIVNVIFDALTAAMQRGDPIELRGFGAFGVKSRSARTGRNPRTQAYVSVKEKRVPYFKTGKEMRVRLNRAATT